MKSNILDQPMFRLIVPSFYGLMMYILILLVNNSLDSLTDTVFTSELLLCVVLAYLISEPIRLVIIIFERRLGDGLRRPSALFTMIGTNLLVGALIVFGAGYLYFTEFEGARYFSYFQTTLVKLTIVYGLSAVFYTIFFLSVYFLSVKNESELKKEDLKRQNLEHQLEIFNNQINPDLLFQSLETLISLVHHNLDEAEDFVDRLAQFYRAILDNRKKELIPLSDELRSCKHLMYLFQARYPEQLSLEVIQEEKADDMLVVPSSISMTLDCIINGSIISQYQPMKISLDCDGEEGYMVICYQENEKLSNSRYIKNCRKNLHEAYAYFTDKPVIEIKAYGDAFVKLPQISLTDA
jgi:two-component system LytT family sensor kinase